MLVTMSNELLDRLAQRGGRVLTRLAVVLAVFGVAAHAQPFAVQLNPTGDPIGGGPGYSDVLDPAAADFVVSTTAGLVDALAQAQAGDVVYVEDAAVLDLSDVHDIVIPGGVTLASGRGRGDSEGALLFSNTTYDVQQQVPVFLTGGSEVRVTGLRFRGPSAEIGDHDYEHSGTSNLLRVGFGHDGLEVDNCELWAWGKWAIWLYYSDGAHIHHNNFHHNQRAGYGYSIWCGGAGSESGSEALIEANYFDYGRHFIGSSGHPNSWEARYNIAGPHTSGHKFDRHNHEGLAGIDTRVHHNWFIGTRGEDVAVRAEPGGTFSYEHNWSSRSTLEEAVRLDTPDGLGNAHFVAGDNHFGGVDPALLPSAQVAFTPPAQATPVTVTFDGTASTDPEGYAILQHRWSFGDGQDAIGATASGPVVSHTFTAPGIYPVELTVVNGEGIVGTTLAPISVGPSQSGYLLSAWVQDSYSGPLTGFYTKQILLDGEVIWQDDVAGDAGWQHVVLDVGKRLQGRTSVDLTLRLYADAPVTSPDTQIEEIFMYLDDVHIFGATVRNGDMEAGTGWYPRSGSAGGGTSTGWSSTYASVGRSGKLALRVGRNLGIGSEAGTWGGFQQSVPVNALAPTTDSIPLQRGWNTIALRVWPETPELDDLLSGVLSAINFVKDAQGHRYEPGGLNEIGAWDAYQAYYVHALEPTTLEVTGVPIVPEGIPLPLGASWSLVPYFGSVNLTLADAFASIAPNFVMAKGHFGQTYYPGAAIDGFGTLTPGQGYWVYLNQAATLLFPARAP